MSFPVTAAYGTAPLETKAFAPSGTANPSNALIALLGGSPTASKVRVNAATAMRCPPVKRAVDLISSTLATLPVRLLNTEASGQAPAPDHPAFRIVSRRANAFTHAGLFHGLLARDAVLHGDGFAYVVHNGDGHPRELHHLPLGSTTVELEGRRESVARRAPALAHGLVAPGRGTITVRPTRGGHV